jgi:integrase
MATFSKRVTASGEVTHQAKCRRKGFPTLSKTFQNLSDAKKWARQIERSWDTGEDPATQPRTNTTLADVLRRYRDEVAPNHKGGWIEQLTINAWLRDHREFADTSVHDLSPAVIAAWRDQRLKELKASTVARQMNILYSAISKARVDWSIPIPECKVKRPKQPPHRDRVLTADEEKVLMAAARESSNKYLAPAIQFALATSMRAGELIALLWSDVDEKRKQCRVREAKNGQPRDVPLSTAALAALKGLDRSTKRVFEGLTSETLKRLFIRLTARCEIENMRWHDLRHTALTRYAKSGLNPLQLAVISGHKDIKMLQRYTHLKSDDVVALMG